MNIPANYFISKFRILFLLLFIFPYGAYGDCITDAAAYIAAYQLNTNVSVGCVGGYTQIGPGTLSVISNQSTCVASWQGEAGTSEYRNAACSWPQGNYYIMSCAQ